eukprot:g1396.t1
MMSLLLGVLLVIASMKRTDGCTTFAIGAGLSETGAPILAHTNDGDGNTVGNLKKVPRMEWPKGSMRKLSRGGEIPQVARTHSYYTKVGGYAATNGYVSLAESTCNAVFSGRRSPSSLLNIVDLSELALERATSAEQAIRVMGNLAELHGYYDAGESLFVGDNSTVFVFHILPTDVGNASAIWIAQELPKRSFAVVANSYTIRKVNFTSPTFLFSKNMKTIAVRSGRWDGPGAVFDFVKVFSGDEMGHPYSSGRRMWSLYSRIGGRSRYPSDYNSYVQDAPYPTFIEPARSSPISLRLAFDLLRDFFQGTKFSLSRGVASGPFNNPVRFHGGENEQRIPGGYWERPVATWKTIVGYVTEVHPQNPDLSILWYAPHSPLCSTFVPFIASVPDTSWLPRAYTNNSLSVVDRTASAWQASRFVFNLAITRYNLMAPVVAGAQHMAENRSIQLQQELEMQLQNGTGTTWPEVWSNYSENAAKTAISWWRLFDFLMLTFADGVDRSGKTGEILYPGYPFEWLVAADY